MGLSGSGWVWVGLGGSVQMWLESSEAALEGAQCRPDRGDAIGFSAASPSTVRGGACVCLSVPLRITAYLCVSLRTSACVCERVWNWRMLLWRQFHWMGKSESVGERAFWLIFHGLGSD